jgi:hypothetical protein
MKYYLQVLQPDENIRYVGKLHWIIYGYSIILGVLAIILATHAMTLAEERRFLPLTERRVSRFWLLFSLSGHGSGN